MTISRRYFLKNGGVAMLGMAALPSFLQRAVVGTPAPNQKKMVVLFQRGAMDGLNVVVPFGEPNYYRMRPTIAIPQPRQGGAEATLDLDGFFGLHPSLAPDAPSFPQRTTSHRASRRLPRSHALALRRPRFHGIRYPRPQSHRRRLAQSRLANHARRKTVAISRGSLRPVSPAHAPRQRLRSRHPRSEAIQNERPATNHRRRIRSDVRANGRSRAARRRHRNFRSH